MNSRLFARLWVALTVFVLIAGVSGLFTSAQALESQDRKRGVLATAQIHALIEGSDYTASCSATVVDPAGYILTAYHCIGVAQIMLDFGQAESGQKLGDLYHPNGLVAVAPTLDSRKAPIPTYWAVVVAGAPGLDLAVLKIVAPIDQDPEDLTEGDLPEDLPLVVMPLGNADAVDVGDPLFIVGYPEAGGRLVTVTSGTVAGFDDYDGDGEVEYIKTDAASSPGNSGGLVMGDTGEQVGVVSWGYTPASGASIGYVVNTNYAQPYVEAAIEGKPLDPGGKVEYVGPFGAISFDTSGEGETSAEDEVVFPEGTNQVFGNWEYEGIEDGTEWGYTWYLEGEEVLSENNLEWELGESGLANVSLTADDGMPNGDYELALFVEGVEVQHGSFVIGETNVVPGSEDGVVIQGTMIDADTERAVRGGFIFVFKPGVTWDDIESATTEDDFVELIAAYGETDRDGAFLTAPAIARGESYAVAIGADGYQLQFYEAADGLVLDDEADAVIDVGEIPLVQE